MRRLFVFSFVLLAVALALTRWSEPDLRTEVPILYWVIDPAPVRAEHIRLFELWQVKNGHSTEHVLRTPDDVEAFRKCNWSPVLATAIREGNALGAAVLDGTLDAAQLPVKIRVPMCELRLDAASNDMSKKIVQSVSGIAGDVMEVYADGNVQFMAGGGLAADVTETARRLHFAPDVTYAGLETSLMYNDRQFSFPRNPNTTMLWVNKETFARYGQPLPPVRWSIEEFEIRGKAFMAAANPPGQRRQVFFANSPVDLLRTLGVDTYNETLTRCVLDDPRAARAYALNYKWTEVDHLFPNSADMASFATAAGEWGGGPGQLFAGGKFAMLASGRFQLMQFRKFEQPIQLAVVEPPNGGIPCNGLYSGQAIVYRGSRYLDLATLFLAFYASEDYSMQIVRDGDGLPPIPQYTRTEEFLRPAGYTNEWGCHERFAENAIECGVGISFSPFIEYREAMQPLWTVSSAISAGRTSPEEGVREMQERLNHKIELAVNDNPRLQKQFQEALRTQALIEQYRREGRPVPREWVTNPFHRFLYERNGWFERKEAGRGGAAGSAKRGVGVDGAGQTAGNHS